MKIIESEQERYKRAELKVKQMKGFYWHLFWYLVVNIFLTFGGTFNHLIKYGEFNFSEIHFGNFTVWFFWGIGLAGHWLKVFGNNFVFSRDWEKRKIKEYMDKDQLE